MLLPENAKIRKYESLYSPLTVSSSVHQSLPTVSASDSQLQPSHLNIVKACYSKFPRTLLGCIECMRCRLLLPMCAVSVCLSRGSTRLHCAKMAKQIKILFGMNTQKHCDPHTARGDSMQPSPNYFGFLLIITTAVWYIYVAAVFCKVW